MLHTGRCVVHVEVTGQVIQRHRRPMGQYLSDIGQPVMKSCHHRIDLDPVAGRQQQRFRDVLTLQHLM